MIKQERHARICEYLDKHQFASINTLMEQIGASKSTVRRDLMELQEEKKIAFVRGGAASTNQQFVQESPYHVKQSTNTAEKERIGAAAAQLVQTGETIFLASGTTTRAVLPGLSEVDFLNLVTNDLQIAMDAAEMENIALTMTGGSVRPGYYALRGVLAEDSMRVMKTGTAFVSCDAIDIQTGCYIGKHAAAVSVGVRLIDRSAVFCFDAELIALTGLLRQVVESTSYLVLLADHSKFFSGSFLSFCPIERVDLIISDTGLPADLCDEIRKKNIKLILA